MNKLRLLIGGSPCFFWAGCRKKDRETTPKGKGWELAKNYIIAKEKFKPDYFLYENNKSIDQSIKDRLSQELGYPLQHIDSSLVSAQHRERFYIHNIPNVPQPKDKGILLKDIVEDDVQPIILHNIYGGFKETKPRIFYDKSPTIRTSAGGGHLPNFLLKGFDINNITLQNVRQCSRKITVKECCRLQTFSENYFLREDGTQFLSNTQAYNQLGNSWTVDVIKHILGYIPNIHNCELEVLSMYDGISAGQVALTQLGCKIKKYWAIEIDNFCITTTQYHFPKTIQLGDAFQVREKNWSY